MAPVHYEEIWDIKEKQPMDGHINELHDARISPGVSRRPYSTSDSHTCSEFSFLRYPQHLTEKFKDTYGDSWIVAYETA